MKTLAVVGCGRIADLAHFPALSKIDNARIKYACDLIPENNIKALFVEPDYSGSAAEILAAETDVKIYVLNPVTRGEATLSAYEDIMRENIQTILKAVS